MNDNEAVKVTKSHYEDILDIQSIVVKDIDESVLNDLIAECDKTKYMEEQVQWYDDEEDFSRVNWVDVEGQGYGWLWLKEEDNEDKWHSLLRDSLIQFVEKKKSSLGINDSQKMMIVRTQDKCIFHFIQRELSQSDIVYTFSNDEIFY